MADGNGPEAIVGWLVGRSGAVPAMLGGQGWEPMEAGPVPGSLFRLQDGTVLHVGLQSSDDGDGIGWRMVEGLRLVRSSLGHTGHVRQAVLRFGTAPTGDLVTVEDDGVSYSCGAVDLRSLPAAMFLDTGRVEDAALALLCRDGGEQETLDAVAERFGGSPDLADVIMEALSFRGFGDDGSVRDADAETSVRLLHAALTAEDFSEAAASGLPRPK